MAVGDYFTDRMINTRPMPVLQSLVRSWRRFLPITIIFCFTGISLLRKIYDSDIWFHMVVGREVLRHMQVPGVEFYILPRLGEPGEFHEWGFGVLYYLINQYAGYAGMALANAFFGCGILLFLYLAGHEKGKTDWWQSLPVIALVLWVIEWRINFRPETLLYLLLAAEIFLLESYLSQRKLFWLIPLPFLAWLLNLGHPSAIFLIGVFGMYAVQAVWSAAANKLKVASELFGVAMAMVIGAMLNPYGLRQLLLPFYFQNDALKNSLIEFYPALQSMYAPQFITISIIGLIAIILGPKRRWVDIFLACSFVLLAFKYSRNTALLGIVMFVPIKNALVVWIERIPKLTWRTLIKLCSIMAGMAGIAAVGLNPSWGIGIQKETTPYISATLIKNYGVQGNILNFFHLGNYLAWNLDRPVFVDGRNYGTNIAVQLHNKIFRADPGWQDIVYRFNIQAIVTPVTLDIAGEIIPLLVVLENDPDWILVGQEKAGLLFLRSPVQESIRILPKKFIWYQAIAELKGAMGYPHGNKKIYQSLAYAYGHLGDVANQQYYRNLSSFSN